MRDIRRVTNVSGSTPIPPARDETTITVRKTKKRGIWITLAVIFVLATVPVLTAMFAKTHLTLTLATVSEPFMFEFGLITDAKSFAGGNTILGNMSSKDFTDSKKFKATGTGIFGTKSTGTIRFTNSCGVAISVSSNRRVWWARGDRYYRTAGAVTFEPAGNSGDIKNIKITAEAIGPEYNASQNVDWKLLATDNCINGVGSTSGGAKHAGKKVLAKDIETALASYEPKLFEKSKIELEQSFKAETVFIPELASFQAKSHTSIPPAGAEANEFELSVTITISSTSITRDDLTNLISKSLNIGSDTIIDGIDIESLNVHTADMSKKSANITSSGTVLTSKKVETEALKKRLNLKNDSQIKSIAASVDGVQSAEAVSTPRFLTFLPKLSRNISITTIK